jgi:hypothetical protein
MPKLPATGFSGRQAGHAAKLSGTAAESVIAWRLLAAQAMSLITFGS